MKNIILPLFCMLLIILLSQCTKDSVQEFYGDNNCDTLDITFSETVDPIMDRNCKSCHYTGNGTGVTLVTYNNIKKEVDNGRLLGSIKHENGYSPMPQGGKLDDCSISKIEAWVNNGAPND